MPASEASFRGVRSQRLTEPDPRPLVLFHDRASSCSRLHRQRQTSVPVSRSSRTAASTRARRTLAVMLRHGINATLSLRRNDRPEVSEKGAGHADIRPPGVMMARRALTRRRAAEESAALVTLATPPSTPCRASHYRYCTHTLNSHDNDLRLEYCTRRVPGVTKPGKSQSGALASTRETPLSVE
jgi:hypothetical protein